MTAFVGIDPSTKTGLTILYDTGVVSTRVLKSQFSGFQRVVDLRNQLQFALDTVAEKDVIGAAAIEGYAYANQHTLAMLVEIGAVMRMYLHAKSIPWYIVPPTTLKKYTTGSGAAKKELMAQFVKDRWGFESPSDDVVDSYALAKVAEVIYLFGGNLPATSPLHGVTHG